MARYEHNAGRVLALPSQSVALLAVLMLRGPQTASELRANASGCTFADTSSVEAFLDELAARPEEKGGRWRSGCRAHRRTRAALDASAVRRRRRVDAMAAAPDEIVATSEIAALKARHDAAGEVDELRALVEVCRARIAKP